MAESKAVSLSLRGATLLPAVGAFRPMVLDTTEGNMEARFYEANNPQAPKRAILWLGDAYGEFDSPAEGMYDRLAERFQAFGTASLRLQYRNPGDHAQAGLDALVGAFMLQQQGFERVVVVGHGQGALGAVQAGLAFPSVAAVALLAPRALAAEGVERLSPKPLLVLHGTADAVIPTSVSRDLVAKAKEPKRLYYYQEADHRLTQKADAVSEDLSEWLVEQLELGQQA